MRLVTVTICAIALGADYSSIALSSSNQPSTPPKQESSQKTPCKAPKVVFNPPPSPPDSWLGKGPKSATTRLELTVDKRGKVKNPTVIQSGGKDVDRQAMEAVRQWRFTPAMCGDPMEVKIQVNVDIRLQ